MTPGLQLALLVVLACALIACGAWIALRVVKGPPEKRERKRRLAVNRAGRLGDAFITEADASTIYYKYSVHGVQYEASQDVSLLREFLPAEPERLIGVANLKYSPKNPANSILLCEEWSGLRLAPKM
jgi:hypothetical protein